MNENAAEKNLKREGREGRTEAFDTVALPLIMRSVDNRNDYAAC